MLINKIIDILRVLIAHEERNMTMTRAQTQITQSIVLKSHLSSHLTQWIFRHFVLQKECFTQPQVFFVQKKTKR